MKTATDEATDKIIALKPEPKSKRSAPAFRQRFKIIAYTNRSGSRSWRVTGIKRDGTRVRENHNDVAFAQKRQVELEAEYHARSDAGPVLRATKLTDVQLRLCEAGLAKLDNDEDLLPAIDNWLKVGKATRVAESPRLDEAVKQFNEWLDDEGGGNGSCTLRERTRGGLRNRVKVFSNNVANLRVNEFTPDIVEDFLTRMKVSPVTRDNYRRALSRFFSWCIQRPRRWTVVNPCHEIKIEQGEKQPPAILTVAECGSLLRAAESKGLAPYVAICLFAGLRPTEARRLEWKAINLKDREIRLEGTQTKTGRPRVIDICDTLHAWLTAHEDKPIFPPNWRKRFDAVKAESGYSGRLPVDRDEDGEVAKLKPWPADVMRHTAISHYFRKTGSYGQAAEQFGNSESVIKNHYQGRVSSDQTAKFYALRPSLS